MKISPARILLASCFMIVAFLGINFSQKKIQISGERASATLVSLGNQANAYCNEATYSPEINDGKCSGAANEPSTRCTGTYGVWGNCTTYSH